MVISMARSGKRMEGAPLLACALCRRRVWERALLMRGIISECLLVKA